MERELPTIDIKGTEFIVDVNKFELREKGDESNVIYGEDLHKYKNGYGLYYDTEYKNWPDDGPYKPDSVEYVRIPEFSKMDPEGMSLKSGRTLEEVNSMSDQDIMFDKTAFDLRVNKGMLPTIDIAGHVFYVDIRMDMLRPKDDFLSNGIVFSEIRNYFNFDKSTYTISYNPKTHEFQQVDLRNIKEFPKDLIAIEFPSERILDPIGYNRKHGYDIKHRIEMTGLRLQHKAVKVPWEKTIFAEFMKGVKNRQKATERQRPNQNIKSKPKGRKM